MGQFDRRFLRFVVITGIALVCYVVLFFGMLHGGGITTLLDDGSMYSVRLLRFHENPTINKSLYYFFWPIHHFHPRFISSRDIRTGKDWGRCVDQRLCVICVVPPTAEKLVLGNE